MNTSGMMEMLGEDVKVIPYRPQFRKITNSVTAAILLQQMFYRWFHKGKQPFYKYKESCDANDYRAGDSWCEELGFSRSEFDTALAKIAQKVTKGIPKDYDAIVWYWTSIDRKTWYEVNESALRKALLSLYAETESRCTKSDNPAIDILYTKNTSENTKEEEPVVVGGTTPNRQTDTAYAEICTSVESNGFGMLTPYTAEEIQTLMSEYPHDWILDAMKVSVSQNKRKLSYATGILRRWRADGRDDRKPEERQASWKNFNQDVPEYLQEMMQ